MLATAVIAATLSSEVNPRVSALRSPRPAGQVIVSPSVAKCNLLKLGDECKAAVEAGAPWLHFSVQDGQMVPKVSFGSPVISALRPELPNTVFDVKLGCVRPEDRVPEFVKAGADILSFHPEATLQPAAVVHSIAKAGCAPGLVLNPGTPLTTAEHLLEQLDVIVVMLVSPGYGGPKYLAEAAKKIEKLRAMCAAAGVDPWIEVDGGVSSSNAKGLIEAGANALVAGGSVFSAEDKRKAINDLVGAAAAAPTHARR